MKIKCTCGHEFSVSKERLDEVRKGPDEITGGPKGANPPVDDTVFCPECSARHSINEQPVDKSV